jgi:hypothetical protein
LGNSKLINTPKPLERMDSGDFSLHLRQASEQLLVLLVHEKLRWLQARRRRSEIIERSRAQRPLRAAAIPPPSGTDHASIN